MIGFSFLMPPELPCAVELERPPEMDPCDMAGATRWSETARRVDFTHACGTCLKYNADE